MVFRFREAELNWRQELAYQRAETSLEAALASAPYTLTLWDRNGVRISRPKGPWGASGGEGGVKRLWGNGVRTGLACMAGPGYGADLSSPGLRRGGAGAAGPSGG